MPWSCASRAFSSSNRRTRWTSASPICASWSRIGRTIRRRSNALGYTLVDRTRHHKEGLQLIEQALAETPDSGAVLDSMGWALFRVGRHQDALGYLEQAKRRINDPEVDLHLGEVLLALDRKDDARDLWQKASERYPENDEFKQRLQKLN